MFALEVILALVYELPGFLDVVVRHALGILGAL